MANHTFKPGDLVEHKVSLERFLVLACIDPDPDRDRGINSPQYLVRNGQASREPNAREDYQRKKFFELELKKVTE